MYIQSFITRVQFHVGIFKKRLLQFSISVCVPVEKHWKSEQELGFSSRLLGPAVMSLFLKEYVELSVSFLSSGMWWIQRSVLNEMEAQS